LLYHAGEIQLWINGTSVINVSGLMLREDEASHIKGMHFQTFFGGRHFIRPHRPFRVPMAFIFSGNKSDWASPKDQKAWFADVSGAIIQ
jgi:hypothetical protein